MPYLSNNLLNSKYEEITPIDPVTDRGDAIIKSAEDAIQYAPEVPISLITAIVVLFTFELTLAISSAISLLATAEPPGLLISNKIALTSGFSSAFFISLIISSDAA